MPNTSDPQFRAALQGAIAATPRTPRSSKIRSTKGSVIVDRRGALGDDPKAFDSWFRSTHSKSGSW